MKTYRWLRLIAIAALAVGVVASATSALAASADGGVEVLGSTAFHVGDTIHYSGHMTNTNPAAADIEVRFTYPDGTSETLDPMGPWATGESRPYFPTYTIKGTESATGSITGYLRVSGTTVVQDELDFLNADWSASASVLVPAVTVDAKVDFDGDAIFSEAETFYADSPATWQFVVKNTGNCPVTVTLTDSLGHDFGAPFELAKGAERVLSYASSSVAVNTANQVTAIGEDRIGGDAGTVTASDTATAVVIAPALAVETGVDFDGDGVFSPNTESGYVGDEATWRVVVTNTGLDPISNVSITDTNGHTYAPIPLLVPGQSVTLEYTGTVADTTTNDATAAGTDSIGGAITAHDDATAAVLGRRYADLRISKTADKTAVDASGVVTYTVKVENVGNGTAADFEVTDDFDERYMDVIDANGGAVSGGKITWTTSASLAADDIWTITYKLKAKSEDILPTGKTELPNTVVVSLDGGENEMEDPNPQDNTAKFTVTADNPFLPFTPTPSKPKKPATPSEPYLPFTGSNGALLFVLAAGAVIAGLKLRTSSRGDES